MNMPTTGAYRGAAVHDFQTRDRVVLIVQPAIDRVLEISSPEALLRYAGEPHHPPEARLLAADRYRAMHSLASDAHSGRAGFDLDAMASLTAGLDSLSWAD